ncbi:MAG TPA: hypothetical protein VII82_05375, partial [Polyangiaceae bacterium]
VQKGSECFPVADASVDGAVSLKGDAGKPGSDAAAADGGATITEAPIFAGVTAVAPVSSSALLVVWSAGSQPGDPSATLRYRVYDSPSTSKLAFTTPVLQTGTGASSAVVGGLTGGTMYAFAARAVNAAGLDDGNTIEKTGTPANDTMGPVFAGVKTAGAGGGGAVALAWDPATDDLTPAAAMTYVVYASDTTGTEDFTHPILVTAPGATSADVTHLANASKARFFVVRARDAAGNLDSNVHELSASPGVDMTPPAFGGCTAATTLQAITIGLAWNAATDDVSTPDNLAYDVFLSTTTGKFDFTHPFATATGMESLAIPALMTSTTYYFVCRARDEAGNEDDNTVEVSATTGANPVPPTFAGIDLPSFMGDPVARTATLSWAAGSDVATTPDKLVYDVYESQTMGGEAFTKPPAATSAPGALSIVVTNIPPNTTTYFVVRARDADGNRDSNVVEASLTTNVSFSLNIQPIFSDDCGVVGCHVPGSPAGNLILAQGFAYAQIVNVTAGEKATLSYVTPGDPTHSYLAAKINYAGLFAAVGAVGSMMPAPSTGSTLSTAELNTIANWITQGAVSN